MDVNQFTVIVDATAIAARPGQNLLDACLSAKRDIPYFCWHPALGSVGSCRQCAVTLFDGPQDRTGQIVMACMTPAMPGMRVAIADPAAVAFREQVIEFVLTNHPHDCPVCEVGGECHLQDMTVLAEHGERRYRFSKRTHLNQALGPFIRHEMNRCIGCYRCVRFYRDYAGGRDFGVFGAARNVYYGRAEPGVLESDFAGNLVEVCPTGVFVDKPFSAKFRRRWDMRATPSICPHCAVGCNITLFEREGEFRRVTNRYNETLNGYFLCDRGRFGTGFIESAARLRRSKRRDGDDCVVIEAEAAGDRLAAFLNHDGVIGIGSPRASIEANFALRTLVGSENFYAGIADQDAVVLATAVRLMRDHALPIATLADAEHADAVLILGDDPSDIAPRLALSLRQAAQRATAEALAERQIAGWNDTPARIAAGVARVKLFVATPIATRLDDVAAATVRLRPDATIGLAFAVARQLDAAAPQADAAAPPDMISAIAASLHGAAAPVIVVGGQSCGDALLLGAANVVIALRQAGIAARLSILLPEVDSLGLGLLDAKPLSAALDLLCHARDKRVVVLENDLHRRAETALLDRAFARLAGLCVLDHIETSTVLNADLAVAVGCFADTDCTFVNLEGRAQRGFKAIFGADDPPPAWQVLRDAGIAAGRLEAGRWSLHAELMREIGLAIPALTGCAAVWPAADQGGMRRPATLPHRYSGRTAVDAHRDVREPMPPEHLDSPLGTTMEGPTLDPAAPIVPFFWAPGWNSAQAVNKFQTSIGGSLLSDHSGIFLFGGHARPDGYFPAPSSLAHADRLLFLPALRVFGSEELSAHASPVASRITAPTVAVNRRDAARLQIVAGGRVECRIGTMTVIRIVVIDDALTDGVLAIVTGFPAEGALSLPGTGGIRPC